MADHWLVEEAKGPAWDPARGRREQAGWDEHAAFMEGLAADGFAVLGGPVGEGEIVLLVVAAGDEDAVRARLAEDPWMETVLTIASIRPWTIWLRATAAERR